MNLRNGPIFHVSMTMKEEAEGGCQNEQMHCNKVVREVWSMNFTR